MRLSCAVRGTGVALAAAAAMLGAASAASAGAANAGIAGAPRGNPIARVTWKPDEGSSDSLWNAYAAARGHRRSLLGR